MIASTAMLGALALSAAAVPMKDVGMVRRQADISPDCPALNRLFGFEFTNVGNNADCCTSVPNRFQCNNASPRRVTSITMDNRIFHMQLYPDIMQFTEMTYLTLYNNSIPGVIPTQMGQLSKLGYLNLGVNQFSGSIPTEFGGMTSLTTLILSDNPGIKGSIPTELANLQMLQELDLSKNSLTGSVPAAVVAIPTLQKINMEGNLLTGDLPAFKGTGLFGRNCFTNQSPSNPQCSSGKPSSSDGVAPGGGSGAATASSKASNGTVGTQNQPQPQESSAPIAAIVGGIAGGLCALGLVIAFVIVQKRRTSKNTAEMGGNKMPLAPGPNSALYGAAAEAKTEYQEHAYDSEYGVAPVFKGQVNANTVPSSHGSMPPYPGTASDAGSSRMSGSARATDSYAVFSDKKSGSAFRSGSDVKAPLPSDSSANRPSFLDSQFSSYGTGQLDEKTLLRSMGPGGVPVVAGGRVAQDAGPLPSKDASLFSSSSAPVIDPRTWSVEETAQWATKIERIGVFVAARIQEHGINGALLLKATVDDYRNELGLTKLGDRALFGEYVKALKEAAGLGGSGEERDAGVGSNGAAPPSYSY
ncbi:hypothetical protein BJ741DRAFT_621970 [Chytriomyces cf. hyalinus JEL632]|nr:hypothetical protein BJ741DRAFT_621970 [Chytriomyces cf. hyalinus JEL632]